MKELFEFYSANLDKLLEQLFTHIELTAISVFLACLFSIPVGIWIAKKRKLSPFVLNLTGILQTIPSIALLGFLIPILGIGIKPAVLALFLYSLLPIVRNVYTGISQIDSTIIESAKGMGMSFWQILFKVEIPIATPTIFAGIRTATVINVGVATLAAYIAAGGLGEFIFGGIALNNSTMILAGALPAALLAILLDFILGLFQKAPLKNRKRALTALPFLVVFITLFSAFTAPPKTSLTAGFAPEFSGRKDGLPALKQTYNLQISNVIIGPALMYKAIHEDYVDVISGYSTDGRIQSYGLKVLEDDLNCFPPYQAALLVNEKVYNRYPNLDVVTSKLNGLITDSLMTYLNFLVDDQKQTVKNVATGFLQSAGLYEKPAAEFNGKLIIGSKIFTEQYLLTEIYKQLIEGHAGIEVITKNGLGGTKICFDALLNEDIDMYPEYSGTALQVLLNSTEKLSSPKKIYAHVKQSLHERFQLDFNAPLGFNNTYALMMRKDQAEKLKINSVSDLVKYLEYQ